MTPAKADLTAVVVDASVAVKTVLAEPDSEAVALRLRDVAGRVPLLVPALFRYEVANAVLERSRTVRPAPTAKEVQAKAELAAAPVVEVEDPPRVMELAAKHGLTAYDAQYLALTLDSGKGARLWTFDKDLAVAARKEGVLATEAELDAGASP